MEASPRYNNVFQRVGNIRPSTHGNQFARKPAGIYKRATTSPTRRSGSPISRMSSHASHDSFSYEQYDTSNGLIQLLLSQDFLDELNFTIRGREVLLEKRQLCTKLQADSRILRSQADDIRNGTTAAQEGQDLVTLGADEYRWQRARALDQQANAIVTYTNNLNKEVGHGMRVFMLAWNDLANRTKPLLEDALLLHAPDEEAIQARLLAPMPENDIYPLGDIVINSRDVNEGPQELSEQQAKEAALLDARASALAAYNDAQKLLESHCEGYANQLSNHLQGISPDWSEWDASWTQADFDVHHLRVSMQYSTAVREAEDALFKAIENAQSGGVEPMISWQIYGFPDRPDDDPADSVRGPPTETRIDAWKDTLPSSPPGPEPWGPGIVPWPSEHMSELEEDVEAWETWSHREEDVQKKRLLEKYRTERPLGWTLPGQGQSTNGGDRGRLMNSHMD